MRLVLSDRLMEIFSKNISYKIITFNDRDSPWITLIFKTAIKRNSKVYKKSWEEMKMITTSSERFKMVQINL